MNRPTCSPAISEPTLVLSENHLKTRQIVGYRPRLDTDRDVYSGLGFKCGLEIHQQLLTKKKLFCHCPAGVYQGSRFDSEVIRHMRPTLSEMGEYDGTALMEKRTRKNITYRIKSETACTYDIDDTPPFAIDREALGSAIEIALMLKSSLVGELHITRKQYLDGSIPAGFQRTAIVGIEGEIPLKNKKIRIIQLSIEEDSCREVSDIGHMRIYTTDRLGMPLIETVTYPEMLTPDEAAEAGQYLRMLVRTSGKVRTGLGAARQDVNVSITGGTRVEIKGVAHIKWIPELTHNEAFRQKALLLIREVLLRRVPDTSDWQISAKQITRDRFESLPRVVAEDLQPDDQLMMVNLGGFKNMLSFFTQPGHCFGDELSGRLKVIACLERPNLLTCDDPGWFSDSDTSEIRSALNASDDDAQVLIWGPADDMPTALETIDERCRHAFVGVPNETRKSLPDGTTIFERVLPGPDRMYPDTDSAPIPIENEYIETIQNRTTAVMPEWLEKLRAWNVPEDTHYYLITRGLVPMIENVADETGWTHKFVALLFGHTLKGMLRRKQLTETFEPQTLADVCAHVGQNGIDCRRVREVLKQLGTDPKLSVEAAVAKTVAGTQTLDETVGRIGPLAGDFDKASKSRLPQARARWIVGQLMQSAQGSVSPKDVADLVARELSNV